MMFGTTFALVFGLLTFTGIPPKSSASPIDFSRDIRPILSNHCLKCHGPDDKQRAAGLRLDTFEGATKLLASGKRAITPKQPLKSELTKRVHTTGALLMPPVTTNKPLSMQQIKLLERWIAAGAQYKQHWAFISPQAPKLPATVGHPIDFIVRKRQTLLGLQHAGQATKLELLRRASLDLTGLPPSPSTIASFIADTKLGAYERQVDKLLASPRYGERWARKWMDVARYADTNGYEKDRPRTMWPWRDYVINAFNNDKSFQAFTIEQLAGDMLPSPTDSQRIATGFHRNTMMNEEGGIDPNEYRFLSVVDRAATTGTTWLGLTIGCAQCHTHKFDPITHTDYYRLFAFLNNADEPEFATYTDAQKASIKSDQAKAKTLRADIFSQWNPVATRIEAPANVQSVNGLKAKLTISPDGSITASGATFPTDTYSIDVSSPDVTNALRITALTTGGVGPGRTEHGNFVITGIELEVDGKKLDIRSAKASAEQQGFPASGVIDSDPNSGWAIHDPSKDWRHDQYIDLNLKQTVPAGKRIRITIHQNFGSNHTVGKFKVAALVNQITQTTKVNPEDEFSLWMSENRKQTIPFTMLLPASLKSTMPTLRHLGSGIVLAGGDQGKSDTYTITYDVTGQTIGSLRLETLTDAMFPQGGPGRTAYEGPLGDFALTELTVDIDGKPVEFSRQTLAVPGGTSPQNAVDGDLLTAWSPGGNIGRNNTAWLSLSKLVTGKRLTIRMLCEKYYAAGIGKFRWSSAESLSPPSSRLEPDVQDAIVARTASDSVTFAFAQSRPELADMVSEIVGLERLPQAPMSLVMKERLANDARSTQLHHRGEFLQPRESVTPAIPAVLRSPNDTSMPKSRLDFARWLVSPSNPLTARVYVNRQWQAIFGRGIVKTLDDFGTQGELPSNQELLDYLADAFIKDGWSTKKLHRLIVTSETYKQSATVAPSQRAADPENIALTRGPRIRLDAEQIRDSVLAAAGQLSPKIGGPSVFPPQPAGVTTEGSYGALQWNVSTGEDRYRRGVYTFAKRTAPFAMSATFDAPSGEACVARREASTTPLQALTLLNDVTIVEAARSLGNQLASLPPGKRVNSLFMRTLCRPPKHSESIAIEILVDESVVAGSSASSAWSMISRALLNTDEMVTKP
jgi:hypothetical protein